MGIYSDGALNELVQSIFKDFPINRSRVKKVGIKPNLCNYSTLETGSTTDINVIQEICRTLISIRRNMEISILDSNGSNVNAALAFELLGYNRARF